MTGKLSLGVRKWLEGDVVDSRSVGKDTGVFAEIIPAGRTGKVIRTLIPVGQSGPTKTIDVPAGDVSVQVRLPSGQILTNSLNVAEGQETTFIFDPAPSSHEWMSWPGFVSQAAYTSFDISAGVTAPSYVPNVGAAFTKLWVRRADGAVQVRPEQPWREAVDTARGLRSYVFPKGPANVGERSFLSVEQPGTQRLLATIPLPWSLHSDSPRVQVLLKMAKGDVHGSVQDVDVLVHDSWIAPMLGYLESGDLPAAKEFENSIRQNAEEMLREKTTSPIAAAAGGYLLLQTRALEQLHDWPKNLASRFDWLPDGAVIHATQVLRTRGNQRSVSEARYWLMAAARRGVPVMTEGVRLLSEGLRMLTSWEPADGGSKGRYRRRRHDDDDFERLTEWAGTLESATRPDSAFTVLEADDVTLRSLVSGFGMKG
jgi:hypothetical protein